MTDILDGFDERSDEIQAERARRLRASGVMAGQRNPDEFARANRLADARGLPVEVVADNLSEFEQQERVERVAAIGQQNPRLGEFLSDPRRMALAGDDLDGMVRLSSTISETRATSGSSGRTWSEFGSDLGLQFKQLARLGMVSTLETPFNAINLVNSQLNKAATSLAAVFGQVPDSQVGMYMPQALQKLRAETEALNESEFDRTASAKLVGQRLERPDTFAGALRYMASNPSSLATDAAGVAGTMVGGIVPGSRAATVGLQATQQASMASADVVASLQAKGYSEQDARRAAADAFGWATAAGVVIPSLTPGGTAFEGLVSRQAAGMAGSGARRAGTALVGETVSEGVEEGAVTAIQNVASLDPAMQGVGGAVAQGMVMGAGMGVPAAAAQYGAGRREQELAGEVSRVFSSAGGAARLQAFTEAAAGAKLGERSPADLAAFVREAEGGNVYLRADQARVLFQDSFDLAELVGGEDVLAEQVNTGELIISADRWATMVARLPNGAEIARHARLRADDLSQAELEGFDPDAELAALGYTPDTDQAAASAEPAAPDARQQIQEDVQGQLIATGRYTPAAAESQAKVWAAAFSRFGESSGQDAMALYQRYMGGIDDGRSNLQAPPGETMEQSAGAADQARLQEASPQTLPNGEVSASGDQQGILSRAVGAVKRLFQSSPQPLQSAPQLQTETAEFKRWFGDSDVVDADGMPLIFYHGGSANFDGIAEGGRFGGAIFVREGEPSGYGETQHAVFVRGPILELGEMARLLNSEAGDQALAKLLPSDVDEDIRAEVADALTDGSHYPDSQEVWDVIGATDEADAQLEIQKLRASVTRALGYQAVRTPDEFDGQTVMVLDRSQIKSATANRGTFDPNNPSIFNQQPNAAGPRGQISIFPDRRMSISLFEKADRSTFIHESGHFFLEVMRDIAAQPDASDQVKADFAALLEWFGVEEASQIGTEQHEQFARGFEQYLGEGRAPSPELQSAFSQFKAWILSIYKSLVALNVDLTDDVRGVFDRLLASEVEIEAAQGRQNMRPIARDASEAAAIGLTKKQFADYQAMLAAATEEAKAEVMAKLMTSHDRARAAWWKEETAAVRAEVEAEYEATPVWRAARVLRGAKTLADGTPVPEALAGLRLDKAALAATYGEAYMKRLSGLYRVSDGVHPDVAASLLGFESGDALVKALANRGDLEARVAAETADRMRQRHGDPMTDGTIAEVAMDAVHNSRRIQAMEYELAVLSALAADPISVPNVPKPQINGSPRTPTPRAPLTPETLAKIRAASARRSLESRKLKAAAQRLIAGKSSRQIKPNDYLAAERRAAKAATTAAAKGDYAAALLAKRQQALNVSLYAEARAAQAEFDKHKRYLRKVEGKRADIGKAGADYLEQIDALLEGLELRQVSGTAVQRRQNLAAWVAAQEAAGIAVNVPQRLLDEAQLVNLADLPMDRLREVIDTIKQIEHLAKLKNKLLLNGELRDRAEVDAEMADSILAAYPAGPERTGDETRGERIRKGLTDLDLGRLLPTNIARELDGYVDGGPVWRNVIMPIREAIYTRVQPQVRQMQEQVAEIYGRHYRKEELRQLDSPVYREAVDDSWSKGRILSLAMNWGSSGNREAILEQAHSRITEAQAVALLRTLDARDWAFVQDMVDQVNSYWPQIAETQRRRTGLVPEKVEVISFPIETADGQTITVRGGYFPLKYDAERSGYGTTLQELDQVYNDLRVGRTAKAATRNGHTIERVGSGGKTVNLGLDIAQAHMRDVIRDIHLGDAIGYVHNVIHGIGFTEAAIAAGKRDHLKALDLWLKDVAADEMGARSVIEKAIRFARQNTTAAVLSYKASSAMLQMTGLIQTASVIGRRNTLRGLQRLLSKSWHGPHSIWNDIRERSPYMAERFGKIPDAVQSISDARDGRLKAGHAAMLRWGYIPMARMQMIADAGSWLAAEAYGLRKFEGDVEKARAFADDIVIRAQSPDNFIDKPALARGTLSDNIRQTEIVKSTTMLLSYMMAKGNIAREKYQQTRFTRPAEVAKFSADMLQLFAVETLIMALFTNGLPDDEEDDGTVMDDYAAYLVKEVALGNLATVPLLSQLGTEGRGYTAQGVMERSWSMIDGAGDQLFNDQLDRKDAKALVNLAGLATGLPSSQINTTSDALWRVRDGEDVTPIEFVIRPSKPRD